MMNIKVQILTFLSFVSLLASCAKESITKETVELDWSKTSQVTLGSILVSSGQTRAEGSSKPMAQGERFRLYAIDPITKAILATRVYKITDAAGTPAIENNETPTIDLPYGTVDIFLVGPVSVKGLVANEGEQGMIEADLEVAGEKMVTPRHGVDLVASRTRITISTANMAITAPALEHKMTQVEIEIAMAAEGGNYYDATMDPIADSEVNRYISLNNMGSSALFSFDENGGTITCQRQDGSYEYTLEDNNFKKRIVKTAGTIADSKETGAKFTVKDYFFPLAQATPTLTTIFGYNRKNDLNTFISAHLFSGEIKDLALNGGTSHKLTAKPIPGDEMVCSLKITDWNDGGTSSQEQANNENILFWYSGEDAPKVINGKLCWPDRSGNGNHAEIVGNMSYDKKNKCYYAAARGAYFIVPPLGHLPAYTFEITAQSTENAQNRVANFSGDNGLSINLPLITAVEWKPGANKDATISSDYGKTDKYIYDRVNTYAFARSHASARIYRNGQFSNEDNTIKSWDAFDNNTLWVGTVDPAREEGKVGKQRIFGARMYKSDLFVDNKTDILLLNHVAELSKLGVNAPIVDNKASYVREGLILDLRGEDEPSNGTWMDQSGFGNHAKMNSGTTREYSAENIYYYKGGCTFLKSLGTCKELTIEAVVKYVGSPTDGNSATVIQFSPNRHGPLEYYMYRSGVYWCDFYTDRKTGYVFEAPYINDEERVRVFPLTNLEYEPTTLSQLSCYRLGDRLYASQNGFTYDKFAVDSPVGTLNELFNGTVGDLKLQLYTVRIYNRALTDAERQHNYLVDKSKYRIL